MFSLEGRRVIWRVLGGLFVCSGITLAWLAMEKMAIRRWRRRQRARIRVFLTRHPEAGELQVDGTYCYRRGAHDFRYLYRPERSPADQVVWLTIKQRVTPWDRPSLHVRRRLMARVMAWATRLFHWQLGAVLILLLIVGIVWQDHGSWRPDIVRHLLWLVLGCVMLGVAVGLWCVVRGLRRVRRSRRNL